MQARYHDGGNGDEMTRDAPGGDTGPAPVRLHLHRGIGWGVYGTATVAVLVLVVLGAVSYLTSGRFVMAAVVTVFGLGAAGFLALVTHSIVVPDLTATAAGVSGRMPRGNRVDAAWDAITVDVDDTRPPGTFTLGVGDESVAVSGRSWVGFEPFLLLVGSTPTALARLTPAALQEVIRLLETGRSEERSRWH